MANYSKAVHLSIAALSFPKAALELIPFLRYDEKEKEWRTNLQDLMELGPDDRTTWSVPRWYATGDVLLFYQSSKVGARAKRVLSEIPEPDHSATDPEGFETSNALDGATVAVFEELEHFKTFGGKIFGAARVVRDPWVSEADEPPEYRRHWRSRVYAEISDMFFFDSPLSLSDCRDIVRLRTGSLTPVYGDSATTLVQRLGGTNRLPRWLRYGKWAGRDLHHITRANWLNEVGNETTRFVDEAQLRAFCVDFLLDEIKDPRTTIERECRCSIDGLGKTPIADYFISIGGEWMPVEVKLNANLEPRLLEQVGNYLRAQSFRLADGASRRVRPKWCLIVDSSGCYVANRTRFLLGRQGRPYLETRRYTARTLGSLRKQLIALHQGRSSQRMRAMRGR